MKYIVAAALTGLIALTWLVVEKVSQTAQIAALTAQMAKVTAEAAALRVANQIASQELTRERAATKSKLARAKLKQKAVSRMQRFAAAAPFIGVGVAVYFEERDFADWREDHPELHGTPLDLRTAYWNEVYESTADALDNEYASLKDRYPGLRERLLKSIPFPGAEKK